jgi:hypothetical protein
LPVQAQPVEGGDIGAGLLGPHHVCSIGLEDVAGPLLQDVGRAEQGLVADSRGGNGQEPAGRLGTPADLDE